MCIRDSSCCNNARLGATLSHKKWIPNTFLDELLAEIFPRCFRRECQSYIPVAAEFIKFSRSYGNFPHFAETSNPSNFLFFWGVFVQRSRTCWCLSINRRPKISASNSSIYFPEVHIISSRTAGWTSSYLSQM